MIRLQASAVLAVRDGYTGRPVTASAVQCFLDGQRVLPQYRQGGYLVFLNLPDGPHQLLLRGAYYQDERLQFQTAGGSPVEWGVTLKPSAAYPFRRAVTQLAVRLEGGGALWVAAQGAAWELRLAQDEAPAGSRSLKIFYRGGPEAHPRGQYLLCDKSKSETVTVAGLEGERAELEAPLAHPHRRGAVLLPAQCYHADAQGWVRAFFREPVQVCLFLPEQKKLQTLSLQEGYNETALANAQKKE
ncbi:MAG TPA: hypothetical protein H9736_02810 [Candidatus Anaerotruncus excrementipullorum]|uniref:Uncharacterized protein n=1 Tax=Candidatus Anaerotruncus excrementipullorum TaxID=2838465 RepID=A0A9D2B6X7_9FIRM|nr:hypothetical protein [Candidatus Anaerotruncus excrementipullorum]